MPRHFIALQKYGNLKPWLNSIDDTPPGEEPGSGGASPSGGGATVEELQAQIAELRNTLAGKEEVINKLRPIERKYKTIAAGLSDERLQELKVADQRLAEVQSQKEQEALKIRQQVAAEYDPKIQELTKEKADLQSQLKQSQLTYQIFKAFNANGGIGSRFQSFQQLASPNFERNEKGLLQIRDDAGQLVIYKDPDAKAGTESERVATPADFLKMLGDGTIGKSIYQFNQLEMLQLTLEPFNKAGGPLLPGNNGYNRVKSLDDMSQAEIGEIAFPA